MKQIGIPHGFDRREEDVNVKALSVRVKAVEELQEALGYDLAENTRITSQIQTNTAEIVELFKASKEMFEFLARWGRRFAILMKYTGMIAGGVAAIWAAIHLRK